METPCGWAFSATQERCFSSQSPRGRLCWNSVANRKNVPLIEKNKKFKNGKHCGQHSGDIAVLVQKGKK
jgi:hypothetical protein